ncbi:MAG TPA: EAL domain-containing protein [Pyrinomonadaceae bacterium]|nr:EAL domain-containing protein [Pyrinomonadaceae bacterium]
MEIAGSQRFPKWFVQASTACAAVAVLISLYRFPARTVGLPFLLLTLLAVYVCSRFSQAQAHERRYVPVFETFILVTMLLLDGEAAVLLSALVALCTSLQRSKNSTSVMLKLAVAVVSTFLIVWGVRILSGPFAGAARDGYSAWFLQSLWALLVVQSVVNASVVAAGTTYKIKQSVVLNWLGSFFWRVVSVTLAAAVACAAATGIVTVGANAFFALAAFGAICAFAYGSYNENSRLRKEQARQNEKRDRAFYDNAERFRSAFDHAAIGMALVTTEGRWLQVNRSLCDILGYSDRELLATDFLTVTHPDDLATALSNIGQLLKGKAATTQMEKRYVNKNGHVVWVHWSASLARDSYSKSVHLIFQIQDITDRKLAEQRLHHDAFHDSLTGLPNRALFMDHLKLAIARSQRHSEQLFAVLYLDLDRFKIINDSLGHSIGDQLLIGIADRLTKNLRPGDTVARLGGDEFTILVEDIAEERESVQIAERIQKELSAPFQIGGREVFTTVSLGIAPSTTGYEQAEDILRDADTAMYRAKSLGKARYEIFDKAMHARAINLLQLETDMRRAIERQEFFVHYQPIVALDGFRLQGFEALVRWHHPQRGYISPMDFIPVAEETGLIIALGEWVLRESCKQMQRWQTIFPCDPPLFISVNLSSKQFSQNDLINQVSSVIHDTTINPRSLKLEITESVVMENIETATEMLKDLRALGVQLSIDDFGTGYSSLSYLHRFPIDTLKIDRSFVTHMSENNENTEIVRTIIVLAQNLGMDVVAEGVETKEQLALLNELGCENGQGYYFSKPVNREGAEKIIADTYSSLLPVLPTEATQKQGKTVRVA